MKANKKPTQSVRMEQDVVREIKHFVTDNGGSIQALLKHGAIWAMTKGAKEYVNKLKQK